MQNLQGFQKSPVYQWMQEMLKADVIYSGWRQEPSEKVKEILQKHNLTEERAYSLVAHLFDPEKNYDRREREREFLETEITTYREMVRTAEKHEEMIDEVLGKFFEGVSMEEVLKLSGQRLQRGKETRFLEILVELYVMKIIKLQPQMAKWLEVAQPFSMLYMIEGWGYAMSGYKPEQEIECRMIVAIVVKEYMELCQIWERSERKALWMMKHNKQVKDPEMQGTYLEELRGETRRFWDLQFQRTRTEYTQKGIEVLIDNVWEANLRHGANIQPLMHPVGLHSFLTGEILMRPITYRGLEILRNWNSEFGAVIDLMLQEDSPLEMKSSWLQRQVEFFARLKLQEIKELKVLLEADSQIQMGFLDSEILTEAGVRFDHFMTVEPTREYKTIWELCQTQWMEGSDHIPERLLFPNPLITQAACEHWIKHNG